MYIGYNILDNMSILTQKTNKQTNPQDPYWVHCKILSTQVFFGFLGVFSHLNIQPTAYFENKHKNLVLVLYKSSIHRTQLKHYKYSLGT